MPLPQALINFGNCPATGQYGFKLVLTTANGNSYPTDWYNINSATPEQVRLIRSAVPPSVGVKASGGISTYQRALEMIDAGASRIGTSSTGRILQPEAE